MGVLVDQRDGRGTGDHHVGVGFGEGVSTASGPFYTELTWIDGIPSKELLSVGCWQEAARCRHLKEAQVNGKVLDAALMVALAAGFLVFAIFDPGLGNMLVAVFGLLGLGYYNSLIRHDPKDDSLRQAWR